MNQEQVKRSNATKKTHVWKNSSENLLSLSPFAHKRSISTSSENIKISVLTNERSISPAQTSPKNLSNYSNLVIPFTTHSHSHSPSELDSPVREKRNISLVARLNEEILILSSQLKQSNEIIAFLSTRSTEFQELNERYKQSQYEMDKNQSDLQKKIVVLEEKIGKYKNDKETEVKILMEKHRQELKIIENDKNRVIEEIYHENKKKMLFVENYFIEIIMNLNHKYIEEVEYLNMKYKSKIYRIAHSDKRRQSGDKEIWENSGLFSSRIEEVKKTEEQVLSPQQKNEVKCTEFELDSGLRQIFNQVNLSLDPERFRSHRDEYEQQLRDSIHSIFDLCTKKSVETKELYCDWDETPKSKEAFLEHTLENLSKRTFLKYFHTLTGSAFYTLSDLYDQFQVKSTFLLWKTLQKKNFSLPSKLISTIFTYNFINKKTFRLYWHSWAIFKNYNKQSLIRNKKLMKGALELWEKSTITKQESIIEGFYHWRSLKTFDKINKLRDFKRFFTVCT
ncbi:hypothetical protein SteCoe_29720 [Stentor coeruleus]|uniref:Uncharacterized protein n=1 Tax=Stentor coeruleus TaxID=5963 RepID=A0A1R2B5C2_9CILI|nr:hypothetical protein SteCoe_29720 [Stentor coeruleus]